MQQQGTISAPVASADVEKDVSADLTVIISLIVMIPLSVTMINNEHKILLPIVSTDLENGILFVCAFLLVV